MYLLKYSRHFKKDLKSYRHDKVFLDELEEVLDLLAKGIDLPDKYHNHPLRGEFKGCFDCHIRSDIVLIYKVEKADLLILLLRVGSHSELF